MSSMGCCSDIPAELFPLEVDFIGGSIGFPSRLLHRHPELFPTGHISCVNRLDRLVSGIVIISRSAEKADELRRAMQDMKFRKFYLARVQGQFDTLPTEKLFYATRRERVIDCVAPLLIVEHKIGLSCVADSTAHPSAKESQTSVFGGRRAGIDRRTLLSGTARVNDPDYRVRPCLLPRQICGYRYCNS